MAASGVGVSPCRVTNRLPMMPPEALSAAAWKVHEVTHEAVAKFSVEGTVRGADIFQKLLHTVDMILICMRYKNSINLRNPLIFQIR